MTYFRIACFLQRCTLVVFVEKSFRHVGIREMPSTGRRKSESTNCRSISCHEARNDVFISGEKSSKQISVDEPVIIVNKENASLMIFKAVFWRAREGEREKDILMVSCVFHEMSKIIIQRLIFSYKLLHWGKVFPCSVVAAVAISIFPHRDHR